MKTSTLAVLPGLLLSLAHFCRGHGLLAGPLSRALVLGFDEYTASSGNGMRYAGDRNSPGVCGDPHQGNINLDLANRPAAIQATYTAGSTITVTFRARVNHGGWIGLKICPSTRSAPSQACFDANPLTNADTGFTRFWLRSGTWSTAEQPKSVTDYTTRWLLPSGLSCPGGCVMQLTYKTANTCIDSCTAAECGPDYAARMNPIKNIPRGPKDACSPGVWTEQFKDCADIAIKPSGGAPTPTACNQDNPVLNQYGQPCETCCETWKRAGKCDGKSTVQGGKVVSTLCCKTCSS